MSDEFGHTSGAGEATRGDGESALGGGSESVLDPEAGQLDRGAPILTVEDLSVTYHTEKETIYAVDRASFDVATGETVGIVGESGSGKTVTARSLMGLIKSPGRIHDASSVRFHDRDTVVEFAERFPYRTVDLTEYEAPEEIDDLSEHPAVGVGTDTERQRVIGPLRRLLNIVGPFGRLPLFRQLHWLLDYFERGGPDCVFVTERSGEGPAGIDEGFVEITRATGDVQRAIRGGKIAMVFQDPLTSLNPVYTVGNQIEEALELHRGLTGAEATRAAVDLLEDVGIPDARRRLTEYPHQFSGGMRQRAVIAMALACDPELLICDEPTTALDVTIQAQILELLEELQRERDLSVLFITHDMGVIAEITDRVNVMYAGEVVETAPVESIFADPKHPYTEGLLESIPGSTADDRLRTVEGQVPTPNEPATFCRFAPRCPYAWDDCRAVHPANLSVSEEATDHTAACLLYPEDVEQSEAVARHERATEAEPAGPGDGPSATPDGGPTDDAPAESQSRVDAARETIRRILGTTGGVFE